MFAEEPSILARGVQGGQAAMAAFSDAGHNTLRPTAARRIPSGSNTAPHQLNGAGRSPTVISLGWSAGSMAVCLSATDRPPTGVDAPSPRTTGSPTRCEYDHVERPDTRKLWNANAAGWIELSRAGFDVYRDLVNTPAFFDLLPPIDGLFCLDLGCGEGHNTRLMAARGARIVALDIAESFIRAAAQAAGESICHVVGDGATLPTAFMSLMDVADPERTLAEVARILRPGGFVQFSVVHPATSTPIRRWVDDEAGERQALAIGDYFYEGPLTETWTFEAAPEEVRERHRPFTITYARRTLTGWIEAVLAAHLTLEAIAEPHADDEAARAHPEVADTRIAPYFLLLRARKP